MPVTINPTAGWCWCAKANNYMWVQSSYLNPTRWLCTLRKGLQKRNGFWVVSFPNFEYSNAVVYTIPAHEARLLVLPYAFKPPKYIYYTLRHGGYYLYLLPLSLVCRYTILPPWWWWLFFSYVSILYWSPGGPPTPPPRLKNSSLY